MTGDLVPYRRCKRVLDKTIAGTLLVLSSPLLAIVGIAMALEMLLAPEARGSWLYREPRISRGCEFDLLKFRVLRGGPLTKAYASGHARLLEADPDNLTWVGRHVLKRWYLDELPQLVNILRGDMSLVGPRPWPLTMVKEQVADGLDYRQLVVAGWTGPAQVQKGMPQPVEDADLDLVYAELCKRLPAGQLLRYDVGILRQTIGVLRRGEGLEY